MPPAADPPSTAPRAYLPCLPGRERGSREDDSIGITKSARADAILLNVSLARGRCEIDNSVVSSRLQLVIEEACLFLPPSLSLSLSLALSQSLTLSRSGLAKTTMREASGAARGLWSCARPLEHVSCSWLSGRRRLSVAASTSTHLVRVSEGSRTILLDYALERFLEVGAHLLRGSSHQLNVRLDHSLRIFTKRAN